MKYKILFFDSWKGGVHNFTRLHSAFEEAGFEQLLVHLGSWGNEEIFIKEEVINNLAVRDISYYPNESFERLLITEKPDAVLFLSTHTFAHRALIRYCRKFEIPTINLYHGFVRVQDVDNKKGAYTISFWPYFRFALQRIPKLLTKTIPCYMNSLRKTNAKREDWGHFLRNLKETVTKPGFIRTAPDAKTSICMVYANADKQHAIDAYGFASSELFEVGNPDLEAFGLTEEMLGFGLNNKTKNKKAVLYIDTALTATGLIVKSKSEYLKHILATSEKLRERGLTLLFKPHPETIRLYNITDFEDAGIEIVSNKHLIPRLMECCAVITEPSTLSLIPAFMAMPLFLAQFPPLQELRFGEVLTSYPRAIKLTKLDTIADTISEIDFKEHNAVYNWIRDNSGPLPAHDMPKRVVNNVLGLLNKNR